MGRAIHILTCMMPLMMLNSFRTICTYMRAISLHEFLCIYVARLAVNTKYTYEFQFGAQSLHATDFVCHISFASPLVVYP